MHNIVFCMLIIAIKKLLKKKKVFKDFFFTSLKFADFWGFN